MSSVSMAGSSRQPVFTCKFSFHSTGTVGPSWWLGLLCTSWRQGSARRHRMVAKWVLHREITVQDLLAADTNNHGFISKSEYVIYKLKEMGKIREKDVMQILDQFDKLDSHNSGKITLPGLLENRSKMMEGRSAL